MSALWAGMVGGKAVNPIDGGKLVQRRHRPGQLPLGTGGEVDKVQHHELGLQALPGTAIGEEVAEGERPAAEIGRHAEEEMDDTQCSAHQVRPDPFPKLMQSRETSL